MSVIKDVAARRIPEALSVRVCPRCGCRNSVRPGGAVSPDYCVQCDPKPSVAGVSVQVHGLSPAEGQPAIHYRLRILDPAGEVVFIQEPMERDEARAMAARISENIISFLESQGL